MQLSITNVKKDKMKWGSVATVFAGAAFVAALTFSSHIAGASGVTFVVDDDGKATAGNCNSNTVTPYQTVSSAVTAAAAGDVVKVCPGVYTEDVTVDKALSLKGAKADSHQSSRTFGNPNESTIAGLVAVAAADVKVEGFSLTNPDEGQSVLVKTAGNNAVVKKNLIQTVGSAVFVTPATGVYLEKGPDNVKVSGNKISDVKSQTGSVHGVFVGDSASTDPSLDTRIDDNTISDLTSVEKGAYGVLVNNGASAYPMAKGYTEVKIRGNTIKNLTGTWAHAIGLEGETPNAVVEENVVSNLTDVTPAPGDVVGVFFEDNPFFFTGQVNRNSLNVSPTGFGIAVNPALTTQYPSLSVDGECNWWGAANGPAAVGTGSGSLVSAGVDFKPWLKSANINKSCGDHNNHDNDRHHGDWDDHDWDHDDWKHED